MSLLSIIHGGSGRGALSWPTFSNPPAIASSSLADSESRMPTSVSVALSLLFSGFASKLEFFQFSFSNGMGLALGFLTWGRLGGARAGLGGGGGDAAGFFRLAAARADPMSM